MLSCLIVLLISAAAATTPKIKSDLIVYTIATNQTDGIQRLETSLNFFNFTYKVIGRGIEWTGGDIQRTTGGGQKIHLLKENMNDVKDDDIILYLDGYDVIVNGKVDQIIERFKESSKDILFSAENFCWPVKSLEDKYPRVSGTESRFLNSGAFIGYAHAVKKMIAYKPISNTDDDQLYYTEYFLENRKKISIGLDTNSTIFQSLNGAQQNLRMIYEDDLVTLENTVTGSHPLIIHGNGPTKINQWPRIVMLLVIKKQSPFVNEFFTNIGDLTYPKHLIHLIIYNKELKLSALVDQYVSMWNDQYATIDILNNTSDEFDGFIQARQKCSKVNCDRVFYVDSLAHLRNDETLLFLIGFNKTIISPMIKRENSLFSNFWGAVTKDGFYGRSDDYVYIVENQRIGLWNVPFVSSCILFKPIALDSIIINTKDINENDYDLELCRLIREKNNYFMWVSNMHDYGYLVNNEQYNSKAIHPELYEIFTNTKLWEERYLHPQFLEYLTQHQNMTFEAWSRVYLQDAEINATEFYIREPCPDVYWFPLFSSKFTSEIINTCEASNAWSLSKHNDDRIPGGYENVPTDDIHMTQLNLQEHWMEFLRLYIEPIQKRIFLGYTSNPLRAPLSFVVRYDKSVQDSLRAHHDASTYTLDISLNRYGKDYTDGGVRFLRYNCSLIETPLGWTLLFPGRLTHLHEGLKIGSGRRYIFVSFVDP